MLPKPEFGAPKPGVATGMEPAFGVPADAGLGEEGVVDVPLSVSSVMVGGFGPFAGSGPATGLLMIGTVDVGVDGTLAGAVSPPCWNGSPPGSHCGGRFGIGPFPP